MYQDITKLRKKKSQSELKPCIISIPFPFFLFPYFTWYVYVYVYVNVGTSIWGSILLPCFETVAIALPAAAFYTPDQLACWIPGVVPFSTTHLPWIAGVAGVPTAFRCPGLFVNVVSGKSQSDCQARWANILSTKTSGHFTGPLLSLSTFLPLSLPPLPPSFLPFFSLPPSLL